MEGPVVDKARVFTLSERSNLESKLKAYKNKFGPQIQILTVKSLEGDSLEDYTIRVVEKWQLGDRKRDDGLLIFLALDDRRVRIEVGDGLEGKMTDYKSAQVIDQMLIDFKKGKFAQGIITGVNLTLKVISGENINLANYSKKSNSYVKVEKEEPLTFLQAIINLFSFFLMSFVYVGAFKLLFFNRRKNGINVTGYSSSFSSSSFSSSSSSSSWSGGGGSFSGGGSSGSW